MFSFFFIGTIHYKNTSKKILEISGISIIVAIRDGGESTKNIIQYLKDQIYEKEMEFILVDDDSSDNTKNIIKEISKEDPRFKYISSTGGDKMLQRKQKALDAGIRKASFNHLLFTDVDCYIPKKWVAMMAKYYSSGYNYLVGNSIIRSNNKFNFVSAFQRIDFLLLMIICRASSYFRYPWACTGQNQGFTKELYEKAGGFTKINHFIGDDTAFMHLCRAYNSKLCFIDNLEASVNPRIETHLIQFISQRIRWVSDANKMWKLNISFFIIMLITFLFYISIPITILNNTQAYKIISIVLLFKMIVEYSLINLGTKKLSVPMFNLDFIIWQIFHIPYICIVGILSYFPFLFKWKGRRL